MSLRFGIFLLVLVLLHVYVWRSVSHISQGSKDLMWWVFQFLFFVMSGFTILSVLMMLSGRIERDSGLWMNYVFSAFAIWCGFLLLFSIFLLIDDFRRVVTWIGQSRGEAAFQNGRSKFIFNLGILVAGIPFVSFMYGMWRNMYNFQKKRVNIPIANMPDALSGLKIVQLSDIHSGTFSRKGPIEKAIQSINAEEPDFIFFTGDLVNEVVEEIEPWVEVFGQLRAKYGVFSILGNHDYGDYVREQGYDKSGHLRRMKDVHRRMGWKLLLDQNETISIGGHSLAIIGMENASGKSFFKNYGEISRAYPGSEKADLKLLLAHDPSYWRQSILKKYEDIALTLSGHTHGMQCGIEIPGFLRWSPVQYVYKEWAGLYTENGQNLYVNRGFGCLAYPGRVGILPEISILTLQKA